RKLRPIIGPAPAGAKGWSDPQGSRPRASARRAAQLIDRDDPALLDLACDLRLLDEPADHGRVVAVPIQQDLDGPVAPQVDVAALEDQPHPPAGDQPPHRPGTAPAIGLRAEGPCPCIADRSCSGGAT